MLIKENNRYDIFKKRWFEDCPWGVIFAERANFEWGYFEEEARLVKKYLKKSDRVLIIGSGNGREARPIHSCASNIVCMDIGWVYLMSGQKLFAREKVKNVSFVHGDMKKLPFSTKSFDFIFFSLYSYANENRFKIIKDIHNILRSGGRMLICANTPLYHRLYRSTAEAVWISNARQLKKEVCKCDFMFMEGAVDRKRPEYIFSVFKKS